VKDMRDTVWSSLQEVGVGMGSRQSLWTVRPVSCSPGKVLCSAWLGTRSLVGPSWEPSIFFPVSPSFFFFFFFFFWYWGLNSGPTL
jgi:hypothetical protein